jgi:hypothetical protein
MERIIASGIGLARRVFFVLVTVFLFSGIARGGQWARTFAGTGDDLANSTQQTFDGGYIVAGVTDSFGAGNYDSWVLKLDMNGNVVWQKAYGGAGDDYANFIQQISNSGYIVAGDTNSYGAGSKDIWLMKLYYSGSIQWQKTYGGTGDDSASAVQQTLDGGYIVAGKTNSFGAGSYDFWVLKLNPNGSIQWQKTYGGTDDDAVTSVQEDKSLMKVSDGYIVGGTTLSFGKGGMDAWALKLDLNGNVLWQKVYGGEGNDSMNSIQQTTDGGYVAAGKSLSFGVDLDDVWAFKLDPVGNIVWQKTYSSKAGQDYANSVRQASDGSYIVAGAAASSDAGEDLLVIKLHGNGDVAGCAGLKSSQAMANNTSALVQATNAKGVNTSVSPVVSSAVRTAAISTAKLMCDAELTLYSPNGGEVIPSCAIYPIEWGSGMDAVNCDLMYSTDSGATWMDIAQGVTGMNYDWNVPILTETVDTCLVKAIAYDSSDHVIGAVTSDSTFSIGVLDLIQPNGGEILKSGTVSVMTWNIGTLCPVAKEDLYYTDDGGSSWKVITSRTGNPESYPWEVPWVTNKKTSCKVKIELFDPNGLMVGTDTSDGFFTIEPSYIPPVTVISPNGGETLTAGEAYDITWETNDLLIAAKAMLYYSANGGTTWSKITAVKGGPKIYAWTVPAVSSDKCKIKVVLKNAAGTTLGKDTSDGYFQIVH